MIIKSEIYIYITAFWSTIKNNARGHIDLKYWLQRGFK